MSRSLVYSCGSWHGILSASIACEERRSDGEGLGLSEELESG